jgi:hypothetical protein
VNNSLSPEQRLYHGLVKPREAEHDDQVYRTYGKEWARIERQGGNHPCVLLDFELKSRILKAIHAARKIEKEVAEKFALSERPRSPILAPSNALQREVDRDTLPIGSGFAHGS